MVTPLQLPLLFPAMSLVIHEQWRNAVVVDYNRMDDGAMYHISSCSVVGTYGESALLIEQASLLLRFSAKWSEVTTTLGTNLIHPRQITAPLAQLVLFASPEAALRALQEWQTQWEEAPAESIAAMERSLAVWAQANRWSNCFRGNSEVY